MCARDSGCKAGDVLGAARPDFRRGRLGALAAQVSSLEAEVARLQAEAEASRSTIAGSIPSWRCRPRFMPIERPSSTAKIENYARKFDELAAVISRSESDAAGYRERLGLAQTVEQMRKQLEARQAGSKLQHAAGDGHPRRNGAIAANAQQTAEGAKRDQAAMKPSATPISRAGGGGRRRSCPRRRAS